MNIIQRVWFVYQKVGNNLPIRGYEWGVYCVNIILNGNFYKGIANFGERPTVKGVNLLLETHIFEFNRDIYGKELTVEFLTFIRPEKKYKDFKILTNQIQKDVKKAKKYHKI